MIQFRSQERRDISDVSARFLISLHSLATDPGVVSAFAEGHVVGRLLNIDGEEWITTAVTPVSTFPNWGGQLYFWVGGDKAGAVAKADLERELKKALSSYESKVRAAAADLVETCLQHKLSSECILKILKEGLK